MKKSIFWLSLVVSFFIFNRNINVWAFGEMSNAREKIELAQKAFASTKGEYGIKMLKEADEVLTPLYLKNSNNYEALMLLGQIDFLRNDERSAEKRFIDAISGDRNLRPVLANFYREHSRLTAGNTERSLKYLIIACEIDPANKKKVVEELFRTGSQHLFDDNDYHRSTKHFFNAVVRLDPGYENPIRKAFITAAEKSHKPVNKLMYLKAAHNYGGDGVDINQLAKVIAGQFKEMKVPQQSVSGELQQLPAQYKDPIVKVNWPPDTVRYKKEDIYFYRSPDGTINDHWILVPDGLRAKFFIHQGEFEIMLANGSRHNMNKLPSYLGNKFKIIPVGDKEKMQMEITFN